MACILKQQVQISPFCPFTNYELIDDLKNRTTFIKGVYRVLKPKGTYVLVCFSYKNGPAWNHFTKEQILELFEGYFQIEWIKHVPSLEGDNVTRYFYEVLMEKSVDQ